MVEPDFKKTEIGEIPEEWSLNSIKGLVLNEPNSITAGPFGTIFKAKDFRDSGVPIVQIRHVTEAGFSWGKKVTYMDKSVYEMVHKPYAVRSGDLLITKMGEPPGIACIYPDSEPLGMVTPDVIKVTCDPEKVDTYFAMCVYNSPQLRKRILDLTKGGTRSRVTLDEFYALLLAIPPLPEQKKIAAILRSVDEAIASTQAVIDQTRKVKQGLLQQLLTRGIGHTRFKESAIGQIPDSWKVVSLQEMGKPNWFVIRSGPFGSSLKTEHFRSEGEPVLTIQSLGEGEIKKDGLFYVDAEKAKELSEYRVQPGDLVFSRVADIGRSVVITEYEKNWLISSNLMRISVNQEKYNPWFLMYSIVGGGLVTRQIEKLSGTTGRPVVSSTMMKQITFAIPPLDEQYAIAMRIQQTEEMIRQEGLAMDRLIKLKNGLLQDLITGRVRVRYR
jgi:type I restriction enzyme S subunit